MTGLRDFTQQSLRPKPGNAAAHLKNLAVGERLAAELGGPPSVKFLRTALVEDGFTAAARKRSEYLDQRIREAAGMAKPEPTEAGAPVKRSGTRGGAIWDRKTAVQPRPPEPIRRRVRKSKV